MNFLTTIESLIATIGFPVCISGCLGWFVYHVTTRLMSQSESREDKLYDIIASMKETTEQVADSNARCTEIIKHDQELLEIYENNIAKRQDYVLNCVTECRDDLKFVKETVQQISQDVVTLIDKG